MNRNIASSSVLPWKRLWCTAALGLLLTACAFGADQPADKGDIDWERAKAIHQRESNGDKLSAEDQAYLDRAKAAMQRGEGPGAPRADGIDMRKARELFEKSQRGETLTADEQAYLEKAKAARNRAPAGPQTRPAGEAPAGDFDMQKVRQLYQKSQSGEKLTPDEQAYLDKAKAAMQRRGQGGAQQPGQGTGPTSGKPAITGQESTGIIPLTQLKGDQKYKGMDGGLYGGGSNVPPESQLKAAKEMAAKVVPLDAAGNPSPDGKAVLMSIGMSNTTMEFSKFKEIADADPQKSPKLLIVDAAQGGRDAAAWANVGATKSNPTWDEADRRLKAAGASPQQVEVIWIKQALAGPARYGDFPGHSDKLQKDVETILTLAKSRYPNLRLAYLSSRIYAGYAVSMLNPEPYSFEGAFAMRGVILSQIKGTPELNADPAKGDVKAPVVLWGPYLWSDGIKGREGDDLVYKREDLGGDGTHPSPSGRQKVAEQLLKFFKSDPTATPWFLKAASAAVAPPAAPAAASPALAHVDVSWSRDDAAHLLRRAGFGGTPAQVHSLHALGRDAAVDYLISGALPAGAAAPFPHVEFPELPDVSVDPRLQGPMLQYRLQQFRSWWLDRMVRSDRPLEEKMTLFWHGLFCSGLREVRSVEALSQQNQLFHREAIGNYKRLTSDILHDAAMIRYLNNDENLKGRPNENLARELMELFTMGEGNGYTEADIPEVARALTGITVDRFGETSQFVPARHDDGSKTIFGKTGNFTPDDVPELIFSRPEPAAYLATRLWQFYGTPDPDPKDVALVAEALKRADWELAPALRAMLTSPSFYTDRCKFALIKSPAELEASTLRLLEAPPAPRLLMVMSQMLREMGQELLQPPNVKGWVGGERWITSATLNSRYNVIASIAAGRLGQGAFMGMRTAIAQRPPVPGTRLAANATSARAGAASTTQPASTPNRGGVTATAADARFARIQELRAEQAAQVQAEMEKLPPVPPISELVSPRKLFAALGSDATPAQVVDAAAARFLQRPLAPEQKPSLLQILGTDRLKFGEPETDNRVRQMIGLLMSSPEYQLE